MARGRERREEGRKQKWARHVCVTVKRPGSWQQFASMLSSGSLDK